MKFIPTPLSGLTYIELDVYKDPRGFFLESYHQSKYSQAGIPGPFVQSNISKSSKATLRGLHAQLTHPQAKLVQVISGEIFDVCVDIRPDSLTYKKWHGVTLSEKQPAQLYVPVGFAHGFCVISEMAIVEYKCTDLYDPSGELHLLWNDPELAITWPIQQPLLSDKDRNGVFLREVELKLVKSQR